MAVQVASETHLAGLRPHDLEILLNGLPLAEKAQNVDYNLDLVRRLGASFCKTDLLAHYLSDSALLDEIAARSYRHVNHFDKIVLVDSGERLGYRLTLHLWCPPYTEKELRDELIHDHRFSFWSTILTGRLVSENFSPAADGMAAAAEPVTTYRRYRYSPEKKGVTTHTNFYEFTGEAPLGMVGESVELQGSAYHLEYRRIHRVILPRESMTCTLVLRGPRERAFSNVYNTAYPSMDTQSGNSMFSRHELAAKLRDLQAVVGGDPGAAGV